MTPVLSFRTILIQFQKYGKMKKVSVLFLSCLMILVAFWCAEAQMMNFRPEDIFTYRSSIPKVHAMGIAYLRLPILADSNYCNLLDLCGNIAGISWKEQRSTLEANYSFGRSSYTSSANDRYCWSYAGNALSSLWWLPFYGYTPYTNRGNLLPSPSVKGVLRRENNIFLISGNFSKEVRYDNDIWTNWIKLQSTDGYFGYSHEKTENFSIGFLGNFSKYSQKYTVSNQLYGLGSDVTELTSVVLQSGISYRFEGDSPYRSSLGAEIQYSRSQGTFEKPQRLQLIRLGVEPIIAFGNGYCVLYCKVGHYIENDISATVADLSSSILFRKRGLPFLVGAGADFSAVSSDNASVSELSISGGVGALSSFGFAGFEVEFTDFHNYWVEGAKSFKVGIELRKTKPIVFRLGYKNTTLKALFDDPDYSILTAGFGCRPEKGRVNFDFAVNRRFDNATYYSPSFPIVDQMLAFSIRWSF